MGHQGDVVFRCDQESVLIDHFNQVAKLRDSPTSRSHLEHNPVGDSAKNGFIESGIKTIEGLVRAIKFGLEEKRGTL